MEILAPISLGELYDKISILEIKSEVMFNDRSKVNNIDSELKKLRKISINCPIGNYLFNKLKKVNKRIWDIEDEIRKCEGNKHFKERFIDLARAVYFNNDKRSQIKREINIQFNSDIIEEKSYEKY